MGEGELVIHGDLNAKRRVGIGVESLAGSYVGMGVSGEGLELVSEARDLVLEACG